ncbi:MAG: MFS transporter [Paenibacillus macerans]|uniref:MFS transporter n=1 Tax=Paenibacillus macerans TaxID=44252 RepID=A0A090ZWZ2_PAEMA|nr:MFS transporter [Paenibacillus macerans]KFN08616.1 major Facilitator Superfamily protein [Paenibacillus macerans]MBS5911780.1 MFS transporter [Paenibacillus macerans]MCY7559045.1 MFS transporter [Paenibacillus macerans]MDU7477737.1 MFS transporter [Paenibacillus macerans]MEC0137705.1 MFS transporter [Paenibacillus macerans]
MTNQAHASPAPSLFRNKFYQTILISNIFLQIGIWVRNFAILMFVSEKTHNDPLAISLISVVEFAPIFVFSFIGGAFADRWKPKKTMIWCDFLSAVSVFVVLITLLYESWETVYFATFISAILSQFSQPSVMKLFKQHVHPDQVQQGMALFQSLIAIFMVLGPSLGIFAYHQFGIHLSIGVMGVAFLLSAVVLFRIPADETPEEKSPRQSNIRQELAAGFRYVWGSPVLKVLGATFAIAGFSVGTIQTLGLFLVTENLGKSEEFLQFLLMVNGIAMLIGGAVVMTLAKRIPPQILLAFGITISALCIAGMGFSTSVPLTLTLQFINGLTMPCIQIGINTLILQWTEQEYVGRVNGVLSPMFMGMMVIMMSLSGVLKKFFPLVGIYAVSGIIMLAGAAILIPIFKYKKPAPAPTPAAEQP